MTPDQIEARLRAVRPQPPASLRERVLAATAAVEPAPTPWWAMVRTWAAAAGVLLAVDVAVSSPTQQPAQVDRVLAVVIDIRLRPSQALAWIPAALPTPPGGCGRWNFGAQP